MEEHKIHTFYVAALTDILQGIELKEIESVMFDFEEEELYEECAGIKKALDLASTATLKELREEYKELTKDKEDEI